MLKVLESIEGVRGSMRMEDCVMVDVEAKWFYTACAELLEYFTPFTVRPVLLEEGIVC